MNHRQRKKKENQGIIVILGCSMAVKETDEFFREVIKRIKNQLKSSGVVVIPPYLHVEAVIHKKKGGCIEIQTKSLEEWRHE